MSTLAQLIERTFREYLARPDDQPAFARLATTIASFETVVEYTPGDLMPEELDLIGANTLIECEYELMLVTSVDTAVNQLTVRRGWAGTSAYAHISGGDVRLTIAPTFTRQGVYDAICDSIVDLFPSVWAVATEAVTTQSDLWEMPASTVDVIDFKYTYNGRWYTGDVELLRNMPDSSTGVAVQFSSSLVNGLDGYVTYRKYFTRPASTAANTVYLTYATDVSTYGVDPEWERAVVVGAAAQLLSGVDVDAATQEFITESLRAQGFPVGSGEDIRDSMLRYREYMLDRAHRKLRNLHQVPRIRIEAI